MTRIIVDNYSDGICDLTDEATGRRWRSACSPTGKNRYENKNTQREEIDMQTENLNAGQELDRRAKAYSREHRVSYSEALREASGQDRELAERYIFGEGSESDAGDEVDREVRAYMQKHNVADYGEALRAVVHEAGEEEAKGRQEFGRRVQAYSEHFNISRDEARARVVLHDPAMKPYAAGGLNTALHEVGVLVAGLPRFKNAGVDFEGAARVLNSEPDYRSLAQKAAGEWLDREARSLIQRRGLPGMDADHYQPMLKEAMSMNPEVAALYNGSRVTSGALEVIYLQFTN